MKKLPLLGAGQASYEEYLAWLGLLGARDPRRLAEAPAAHAMLGRVAADLDAAELLLRRIAQSAQAPQPPSLELRARAMRDYARSVQLILDAIDAIRGEEHCATVVHDEQAAQEHAIGR